MSKSKSLKISAIGFFLFGIFEWLGLLMLFMPTEYLPVDFEAQSLFWALLSGIYGTARLIAGYALWKNRKWGWMLGLLLCLTTMVVAPLIIPFGVIDLILTVIITISLLYTKYGNDEIIPE